MSALEKIINSAKNNNGIVTTAMVVNAGFSRGNIQYLVDKGNLQKSARGVYLLPEVWDDDFFNMQNRFKRGIFSLETALFLWDLTDKTPHILTMTFPATYNITKAKNDVRCVQCKEPLYSIGITQQKSPSGNVVNVYNVEKTLCDILRPVNSVDIQIISDSFKRYAVKKDKNIPLLSEYAKELKVEQKLRSYFEVLL